MASGVKNIATSTDTPKKSTTGLILDEEGNVIPYVGYKPTTDNFCRPSPIARLAAAGRLDKPIPTAGGYAIERSKEPQPNLKIPPESYIYDEDRPFVLGKLNKKALDYPEPAEPIQLPKQVMEFLDALEVAGNKTIDAQWGHLNDESKAGVKFDSMEVYEKERTAALAELTRKREQEKIEAAAAELAQKKSAKPKSRTASASPPSKPGIRSSTGKKLASPISPALRGKAPTSAPTQSASLAGQKINKPKTPVPTKSPGRGDAPPSKLTSTTVRPTTTPKKVSNAK